MSLRRRTFLVRPSHRHGEERQTTLSRCGLSPRMVQNACSSIRWTLAGLRSRTVFPPMSAIRSRFSTVWAPPSLLSGCAREALPTAHRSQPAHPVAHDVRALIVINLVAGHYTWALMLFVLAGISDGLDGLLARTLKQQTMLGQYLDPIADKLLLSTMFMVLPSCTRSRGNTRYWSSAATFPFCVPAPCSTPSPDCATSVPASLARPILSAQVAAVFFVLLLQVEPCSWVAITRLHFCAPPLGSPSSRRCTTYSWLASDCGRKSRSR